MKYLRFKTEKEAKKALSTINKNMGLPKKGVNAKTGKEVDVETTTFTELELCDDGCYTMVMPIEKGAMKGVEGYTEEDYNKAWFTERDAAQKKEREEASKKDEIITEVVAENKDTLKAEVELRLAAALKKK
jgi:hypothetical protein